MTQSIQPKARKRRAPRSRQFSANRWQAYEQKKQMFLLHNPGASADEIEQRCKQIAAEEGI